MTTSFVAMPRASRLAVAVSALLCVCCLPLSAAQSAAAPLSASAAVTLDAVEVRADVVERREQRLRRARHGGSSVSIDRARMAQSQVIGSEDLLRYAPNLTLRSRYIGDRNALIGGRSNGTTTGSRALVYVDGLLISDLLGASFNPPRWGMVGASEIDGMDVLYGPFAAELPGNSMGTTVQITTRYPRTLTTTAEAQTFQQSFADDYGTREDYRGERIAATLGRSHARWRWFGAIGRLDTGSHPMQYATPAALIAGTGLPLVEGAVSDIDPKGHPRLILGPTGIEDTRQLNAKFKAGIDLSDDATLELVAGHWRNDYTRQALSLLRDAQGHTVTSGNWRLADGRGIRVAESGFAPQRGEERHQLGALSLTWRLSPQWSLQTIASVYRIDDNTLRTAASPTRSNGTAAFGNGTGWDTFDLKLDGMLGAHRLRTGVHADHYVLEQRVFDTDEWRHGAPQRRSSAFGGKAMTRAWYLQDEWQVADAWTLTMGARYEHWRAFDGLRAAGDTALAYPTRTITAWSPKLGVAMALGERWTLRAHAAKAVRFPTVSELFQGAVSGQVIVNSDATLRPELTYARELALEVDIAAGRLRASVFEDDQRDSLFSQTNVLVTPNVTSIQNVGRIRNRGIELAGEWRDLSLAGLDLSANLAVNQSRILSNPNVPDSEGREAPRIPRRRAAALLSYSAGADWRLSLGLRHSGRQWGTLDNSDWNDGVFGGVSRYTLLDAKVVRQLGDGLSLGLGVDNVTDRAAFAYHPYPRRTWLLELRYMHEQP